MRSKKSLPMILPRTNPLSFDIKVPVREVNNSGKEVTPARSMPPSKAPETLVFLSKRSTNLESLIDKNTTNEAKQR